MKKDLFQSIKDFVLRGSKTENDSGNIKCSGSGRIKWGVKHIQFEEKKKLIDSKKKRAGK